MTDKPFLVAGATGQLGRHVVEALLARGARVRALVRDPARLGALAGKVEVHRGDALVEASLRGACEGVAGVFSALGGRMQSKLSAGRAGYLDVDVPANLNLIAEARRAGARRFVYVSMHLTPLAGRTAYVRAHELVVEALRASDLDWCVMRPTGFHSAFLEMLELAKRGRVPLFGAGAVRTNPIADEDLAAVSVDCLLAHEIAAREIALGGPDVMSRREIAELACKVAGRGKSISLPLWLGRYMALVMRLISPRMSDLVRFIVAVSGEDAIAPAIGTRRLEASYEAAKRE